MGACRLIRQSKYRNVKVKTLNCGTFDSKLEYKHFSDLYLLQRAGRIKDLQRQVRIPLGLGKIKYIADFIYYDEVLCKWVVFDSKGVETKEFKIKLAWLLESYSNFIFILAKYKEREVLEPRNLNARDFIEFIAEYKKTKKELKK